MALTGSYTITHDMELLAQELSSLLGESFNDPISPTLLEDRTSFSGQNCRYQTDTYQIYSCMDRGYLTVNVHLFQADLASEALSVKISVFSPVNNSSRKSRNIFDSLEALILGHCKD